MLDAPLQYKYKGHQLLTHRYASFRPEVSQGSIRGLLPLITPGLFFLRKRFLMMMEGILPARGFLFSAATVILLYLLLFLIKLK